MNWLRSKAKKLSLLALFALALQLGLSFGHFHNDLAIAASSSQSQASAPDTGHDQDTHRDLCAVCSSVAMTSNAVATAAPSLPLPLTFGTYQVALDLESAAPDSRRGPFRSRAPPQS
ncbi:MAG: DUF2946 domain-containing protein [Afipia sp.]|nr:DUF2946 domain-containing protein [Afipia sp.]